MQHVLEVKVDKVGEVEVVQLMGALDSANSELFTHHVQPLCERGARVVIDCAGLTYVNSMCFALLNRFAKECAQKGGRMAYSRVPAKILQIMQLLGLHQTLALFATLDQAVKAVSR